MATVDLRAGQLRAYVTPGIERTLTTTWTAKAGGDYDLTGKSVSLWIGGTVDPDPTDLTDATEVAGVVSTNTATFTWTPAADLTHRALRLTVDGTVEAFSARGQYPLAAGSDRASSSVSVLVGGGDVTVEVAPAGPQGPPGAGEWVEDPPGSGLYDWVVD